MTSLLGVLALGFFLGMRHATDPDHVIAITTIVDRYRTGRGAALIGAAWGLGHTLTILIVGGAITFLGWVIPPRVGLSMELLVGLMLITLGMMNLSSVLQRINESISRRRVPEESGVLHSHAHSHGDYVHTHAHGHHPEAHPHAIEQTPVSRLDRRFGGLGVYRLARPLVIGIVHGLAGSAAIALLVLTTIKDPTWALLYLVLFGVGTVVGMMMITLAIAYPLAYAGRRFERLNRSFRLASGVISLGLGLVIAYQIGFVRGLFTGNPQWAP